MMYFECLVRRPNHERDTESNQDEENDTQKRNDISENHFFLREFEDAKDALIEAGIKIGRGGGRSIGMMGGKEAALRVLQEEGKPMRARELCDMAHEKGYCNMPGLTPWATIAAAIVTDINAKGDASKFKKVGPGLFTVNEKYKED